MKKQHVKPFKKSALALAMLAALQTNAQEGGVLTADSDNKVSALEETIVVGKFQQSLINRIPITPAELPYTLNVLDRDFLDARNFTRPIEALTTLPNILRTEDRLGTGTAGFLSRGFAAPILVDNRVQNNFRGSGARDDSFVERYEVLKGPASISLGPIGAGGVINTVTKAPVETQFSSVELRADQFGSVGGEFDANIGELGSNVLLRISGAYRDFQFDADETERETIAIRPVITVDISSATSARASVAYTNNKVNPNTGFPLLSNGDIPSQIDTDTFTGFANGEGEAEDVLFDAEINHQFLDNLKLTVRGSQQETDFDYKNTSGLYNYNSADGGPGIGLNDPYVYSYSGGAETESEATFYDIQLAYHVDFWGEQQDLVIGVAYDERSFERLFSAFAGVGPFRLDNAGNDRIGAGDIGPLAPFTITDSELNSIFLEAAIRPNDWLTLSGGLRHDDLDQVTVNFRRGRRFESAYDDDELTFRLGASAEVTDSLNVYASFAQAFVPQFGVSRGDDPVEAETSEGYEVGVKGSAFDGRLTFESGFFYTTRENVSVRDPNNLPNEAFVVTVGELEIQGFEFSGNLSLVEGLNLTANLGVTDIDVTKAGNDEITAAVFPEETGSLYLSYKLQSGPLLGLSLGGGFRYVGKREGPVVDFDSYTIADVNISYPINDDLVVSFDILNVADELYVENSSSFAQKLSGGSVLGAPRTAVLTLRSKF